MGHRECAETIPAAANGPISGIIQRRTSSVAHSSAERQQLPRKRTTSDGTSTSSRGLLFQRGMIRRWNTTEPVACDTNGEQPQFEQPQHHLHAQHSSRTQDIQTENISGAFPDGQHLGVSQQTRQTCVFDVSSSSEAFQSVGAHCNRLFSGREFGQWSQNSQQSLFCFSGFAAFVLVTGRHESEGQRTTQQGDELRSHGAGSRATAAGNRRFAGSGR